VELKEAVAIILRLQAANEEEARALARQQLAEHGLTVDDQHLTVQDRGGGGGGLMRFFRRVRDFQVQVDPAALRSFPVLKVHRAAAALEADYPGQLTVRVRDDGIFVRVLPPTGRSTRRVSEAEARKALEQKEIEDVDEQALAEAVGAADGRWVLVAPRRPELDRDGAVEVSVSADRMAAFVVLTPPLGGRPVDADTIAQALESAGVRAGIDEALVARLVREPVYGEPVQVASGRPPEPGENGRLELDLPDLTRRPALREDGTVDYREIHVFHEVKTGDRIGRIVPPGEGTEGYTVLGETLPAQPGKAVRVRVGKGVQLDEATGILYAARDGMVIQADGIDVSPVYYVSGNVDFSVGNIRFPGAVHIAGDVLEGFLVEADENVIIRGSVVGGTVISHGGDIEVRQGIRGIGAGKVEAPNGLVRARFIDNAHVVARRVEVTDAILHSQVECEESIVVTSREGRIAGGKLVAGTLIESAYIGSVHATRTEVSIVQRRADARSATQGPTGLVRVRQVCHPGTLVQIGSARYAVRDELSHMQFRYEDGEVRATAF